MFALLMEVTTLQYTISGLVSGGGIVWTLLHYLLKSPQRESNAYRQGQTDEAKRCDAEIVEYKVGLESEKRASAKLRKALFSIIMFSDLTQDQRRDIKAEIESAMEED